MSWANAGPDVAQDERVRIPMAHLCWFGCSAAEINCYSLAAFQPGLLCLSGCVNKLFSMSLVSLFRTIVVCFSRPRFVYTLSLYLPIRPGCMEEACLLGPNLQELLFLSWSCFFASMSAYCACRFLLQAILIGKGACAALPELFSGGGATASFLWWHAPEFNA